MVPVTSWPVARVASAGAVALALFLVPGFVGRPAGPAQAALLPIPSSPASPSGAIVVTGSGTVDVTPDLARVIVGVQTTAASAAQAAAANATAADKVRALLTRAGVASADIKSVSVQVWPRYDYRNGESILNGFVASHTLEVTVHDLRRIGAVIDAALAGGATTVQGISYDTNDHSAAAAQALGKAVKDAQAKARAMADAAGLKLGAVVSIVETQATPYPYPLMRDAAAAPGAATQVSPPNVHLTMSVTVGWAIG
jgi:uncharacterized protein